MPISNFYNKTVNTQRLTLVTGTKKKEWASNLSGLKCSIRPVDGSQGASLDGSYYKQFKMYCDDTADVLLGDKIIDGTDVYVVKGFKAYDFAGSTDNFHKNIILVLTT